MNSHPHADETSASFLWTSVFIHILLWCGSLVLLTWWVVPQVKTLLNDFGVELPEAAIWIISLTDWIVNYWYILLPLIALLVAGTDAVVFAMTRSAWLRGLWVAIGCLLPLVAAGTAFRIMRQVIGDLREQVNGSL